MMCTLRSGAERRSASRLCDDTRISSRKAASCHQNRSDTKMPLCRVFHTGEIVASIVEVLGLE